MTEIVLTKEIARKVLETVDAGLVQGLGQPIPGKMCVEAAVNYALGGDHNDKPSCVGSAVRAFKIRLNDAAWPTDADRTHGMRKLAIAQLGSDTIDQNAFRNYVALHTIKRILPIAFRAAGSLIPAHKEALELAAIACEVVVDLSSARAAASAGREVSKAAYAAAYAAYAADAAAAADADADAAAYAAYAAAAYAAAAAAAAADAAAAAAADAYAAAAAAAAADAAATAAAAKAKARIKVFTICAEIGLEALQKLKSPGCEWLDLCE